MNVLVIGASVGGLTVVEALRAKGFDGMIRLVGEERHRPYDRPPLSKEVLTESWPMERTLLRGDDPPDCDLVLGRRAVHLDLGVREVALDDGRRLPYDRLVIATGLTPRRLPGQRLLAGVHTLRTIDEAIALRAALHAATRVAVAGAGVLGCEIAAAARTLGLPVTLVDPAQVPMARQLRTTLGRMVGAMHEKQGVELRLGTGVASFLGTARVEGLELTGGGTVPADLVVVTAGSVPATGWLNGTGLGLNDGVECDAYGRAAPDVYAVGDVARYPHGRVESRTNATEQALTVAANIMGEERPFSTIPYFWSDQYGVKIQVHGTIGPHDRIRWTDGDPEQPRWVALAENGEAVTAAVGWNHPRGARLARRQVG